jgi:hypothetical protein
VAFAVNQLDAGGEGLLVRGHSDRVSTSIGVIWVPGASIGIDGGLLPSGRLLSEQHGDGARHRDSVRVGVRSGQSC